jgi:hypothetical protein
MVRTVFKVLIADVILLVAELEVILDIQNRMNCALGSPLYGQNCLARTSPSYAYSVLTQWFSLVINGSAWQSPLTLDWVQLIAYVLVALNAWYAYTVLSRRRAQKAVDVAPKTAS